jgi:hypothetical protein
MAIDDPTDGSLAAALLEKLTGCQACLAAHTNMVAAILMP